MPDFLQLSGKTFVVFGVANRKSVGWLIAKSLEEQGATVVYSVRSEARRKSLETMLAGKPVFICDDAVAAYFARASAFSANDVSCPLDLRDWRISDLSTALA